MKIGELFQTLHSKMDESDLIPIKELQNRKNELDDMLGFEITSFDTIQKLVKDELNEDIDNFYLSQKGLHTYYYYKYPTLIEMPDFTEEGIRFMKVKERIEQSNSMLQKAIKEKDYFRLFAFIDSKIDLMVFEREFYNIPDHMKYEVFIHFYTSSEYGFNDFKSEMVETALSFKDKRKEEDIDENDDFIAILTPLLDENGLLTIYRGEGEQSTPISKAYSWTIDINTAIFFAGRFDVKGKIWKSKIPLDNILDYIETRNEKEVLVLPKNILNVQELSLINTEDMIAYLNDDDVIKFYHLGCDLIDKDLFKSPNGPHGVLHSKRVLLNAITIAYLNGEYTSPEELGLLIYSSAFHDIGRTNDEIDDTHGYKSFQKAKQLNLLPYNDKDDKYKILQFLIENHNLDDKVAWKNIGKYGIKNNRLAIHSYKVLKDADALDRVRFKDVDKSYLRFKESHKLLLYAYHLLKHIK